MVCTSTISRWQQCLVPCMSALLTTRSFVLGGVVHLVACLLINLLVAAASFHFFETPIKRVKTHFSY